MHFLFSKGISEQVHERVSMQRIFPLSTSIYGIVGFFFAPWMSGKWPFISRPLGSVFRSAPSKMLLKPKKKRILFAYAGYRNLSFYCYSNTKSMGNAVWNGMGKPWKLKLDNGMFNPSI